MNVFARLLRGLGITRANSDTWETVVVTALAQSLAERRDVTVLDVRNPDEFLGPLGHVDGAINLPLAELEARMVELEGYRDRALAVVCLTDKRSTTAVRLLAAAGFSRLQLVSGGMRAWHDAQLSVTEGAAP